MSRNLTYPVAAPRVQTRRRFRVGAFVRHGLLFLMALTALYPVLFMVATAFKTQHQYLQNPYSLPWPLSLGNFSQAVHGGTFFLWFKNSAILTLGSVVLSTAFRVLT